MSLDLRLVSESKLDHKTTGLYVRVDGEMKELTTLEDVKKYLPEIDISEIKLYDTESYNLFDKNITHNLGNMAQHVITGKYNLYQLLWRPEENGFNTVTKEYTNLILDALTYMFANHEELKKYNPENGWGDFYNLLDFVSEYSNVLTSLKDSNKTIKIEASR